MEIILHIHDEIIDELKSIGRKEGTRAVIDAIRKRRVDLTPITVMLEDTLADMVEAEIEEEADKELGDALEDMAEEERQEEGK